MQAIAWRFYAAAARVLRGWAFVEHGEADQGFADPRRGLDAFEATNVKIYAACLRNVFAESYARVGNITAGLVTSQEARDATMAGADTFWKAEVLNKNDLLIAAGRHDEAEPSLCQAITVAREQRARSLELRAATTLANYWHAAGKDEEACDLQEPTYGIFTEGFDTSDLKNAKALLDELDSS